MYYSKFIVFDLNKKGLNHVCKEVQFHKYGKLSFVIRLILALSHDQAAVEHGFSWSKSIRKQNMQPETIIAKKMIKDHVIAHKLEPHTILIGKLLILAV